MEVQCLCVLDQNVVVNQKELWCSKIIVILLKKKICFGGRRNMKRARELDSICDQKIPSSTEAYESFSDNFAYP